MSKLIGNSLGEGMLAYFRGDPASKKGAVILIATTDEGGWPHVAMLSHWEFVARDAKTLRIATYKGSKTTANLRKRGKMTAVVVDRGKVYYIKGSANVIKEEMECDAGNSLLSVGVDEVLEDELPGAEVVGGIRYREVRQIEPHEKLHQELVRS